MAKKKVRFKKACRLGSLKSDGAEVCDSKPTELRMALNAPVTMRQKMRSLWEEFRLKEEEKNAIETIEDSMDFNVSNDDFPSSPYESEGSIHDALDALEMENNSSLQAESEQSEQPEAAAEDIKE
jgi:hypothetical protein